MAEVAPGGGGGTPAASTTPAGASAPIPATDTSIPGDFLHWAAGVWGTLTAPAQVAVKIWDTLSDVTMWRSLGWLFLGIIMLFIGAALWLKKEGALPSVVPLPVPV